MRYLEKADVQISNLESLSGVYDRRTRPFPNAGSGIHFDAAFSNQGTDAGGVVRVSVGQEDGVHAFEAAADPGEQPGDAPARKPGVEQQAHAFRLYVGCIARATARQNTQPQIRPSSPSENSVGDLNTTLKPPKAALRTSCLRALPERSDVSCNPAACKSAT